VAPAVPVPLLVPTVTRYGFASLFETLGSTYEVNTHNATAIVTITARFLSFASFEVGRFLRQSRDTQTELLRQSPSLIPFVVVLGILGLGQPFLMLLVSLPPHASQACGRSMLQRPWARRRHGAPRLGGLLLHVAIADLPQLLHPLSGRAAHGLPRPRVSGANTPCKAMDRGDSRR